MALTDSIPGTVQDAAARAAADSLARVAADSLARVAADSLAKAVAAKLDGSMLVNAPGDYEAELRIELRPNGSADVFLKLYTIPDSRFAYRVGALPASIHPATAAAVLRYARAYLKEGARVLDPCCGSGTLLIERGKLTETAALTGVDIAHKAIGIARENAVRIPRRPS